MWCNNYRSVILFTVESFLMKTEVNEINLRDLMFHLELEKKFVFF